MSFQLSKKSPDLTSRFSFKNLAPSPSSKAQQNLTLFNSFRSRFKLVLILFILFAIVATSAYFWLQPIKVWWNQQIATDAQPPAQPIETPKNLSKPENSGQLTENLEANTASEHKMLVEYLKTGENYFKEQMQTILAEKDLTTNKIEQAQRQLTELRQLVAKRQQVETYYQQIEKAIQSQQLNEAEQLLARLRELDKNLPALPLIEQRLEKMRLAHSNENNQVNPAVITQTPATLPSRLTVPPAVVLAIPSVETLLKTCQNHLTAKRLTSGNEGTALACYREVLERDPTNNEAKQGLNAIETYYAQWAENALGAQNEQKAKGYLAKLAQINPNSPQLSKLREQLARVTPRPVTEPTVATPPPAAEIETLLATCKTHLAAKRLTSGRSGTALECYQQVLRLDAKNAAAQQGLQSIEGIYVDWVKNALAKHKLKNAHQFLESLRKINPNSPALPALQQQLTTLEQPPLKVNPEKTPVAPVDSPKPVSQTPVDSPKPVSQTPVDSPKPVSQTPVDFPKPVSQTPVDFPKPVSQTPVDFPKPVSQTPVDSPKPVSQTPVDSPKPVSQTPVDSPKPVSQTPVDSPKPETPSPSESPPEPEKSVPPETRNSSTECAELFSRESLGIVPLTSAQKEFQRRYCQPSQ